MIEKKTQLQRGACPDSKYCRYVLSGSTRDGRVSIRGSGGAGMEIERAEGRGSDGEGFSCCL